MSTVFKEKTFQIVGAAIGLIWIALGFIALKAWYVGQPPTGPVAAVLTMDRFFPGGLVLIIVSVMYGLNVQKDGVGRQPLSMLTKMYTDRPLPELTLAMLVLWLAGLAIKAYDGPLWLSVTSQMVFGIVSIAFGLIIGTRGVAIFRSLWKQRQDRQG